MGGAFVYVILQIQLRFGDMFDSFPAHGRLYAELDELRVEIRDQSKRRAK